ncbi:MAG: hypothetical protein GY738_17835 [Pseudoalteromonas sp.]|nr:hypothetical protein [Pseudoalteromonas sp.]
MNDLKVPLTMKVMYVASVLIGIVGITFEDDISIVISVLSLIILSCSMSILSGLHEGFKQLNKENR